MSKKTSKQDAVKALEDCILSIKSKSKKNKAKDKTDKKTNPELDKVA